MEAKSAIFLKSDLLKLDLLKSDYLRERLS
jgi:hypothetical protein